MNFKPGDIIAGSGGGGGSCMREPEKPLSKKVEILEQDNKNLALELQHVKSLYYTKQVENNKLVEALAHANNNNKRILIEESATIARHYAASNVHLWESRCHEVERILAKAEKDRDLFHADLKISGENNKKLRKDIAALTKLDQANKDYARVNALLREQNTDLNGHLENIARYITGLRRDNEQACRESR